MSKITLKFYDLRRMGYTHDFMAGRDYTEEFMIGDYVREYGGDHGVRTGEFGIRLYEIRTPGLRGFTAPQIHRYWKADLYSDAMGLVVRPELQEVFRLIARADRQGVSTPQEICAILLKCGLKDISRVPAEMVTEAAA